MRTWSTALALLAGLVFAVLVPGAGATSAVSPLLPGGFPAPLGKPTPATNTGQLSDVSVVSTSFAVAVGGDIASTPPQAWIEMWNGGKWTIVPSNAPANSILYGVSCSSRNFCAAVGMTQTDAGSVEPLILTWNGRGWSVAEAATGGQAFSGLFDVSCPSSSFCAAVGLASETQSSTKQTLVETWDGSTWSVETSDNKMLEGPLATANWLWGVSCLSDGSCMTVGYYDHDPVYTSYRTLALTRDTESDPASWQLTTTADPEIGFSADAELRGVSCVQDGCTAVGFTTSTGALIETWDGTSWQLAESASTESGDDVLLGVSCPNSDLCVAAGVAGGLASSDGHTLVETWDGNSWTVTTSPDFTITEKKTGESTTFPSQLWGVSCLSAGSFTAVGFYQDPGLAYHPLILSWNGRSWTTTG